MLWTYDKVWQKSEFNEDGTGKTDIYYLFESKAVGVRSIPFTYTTSNDGMLTVKNDEDENATTTRYEVSGSELKLISDDTQMVMKKMDATMANNFDKWSKEKNLMPVPKPAKYTVFVYGNAGGDMDFIIENGLWEPMKSLLKDHDNVRVICMYKYGYKTDSHGTDGDIVFFELTDSLDINNIQKEGFKMEGFGNLAMRMKLCSPATVNMFMQLSSLKCPAEQYVFAIWGHGNGLTPMTDIPGKNSDMSSAQSGTRGVIADEWNNKEELNMYELADAIRQTGIKRLNTIFFHNCLMGNIETLTDLRGLSDYITASAHLLESGGEILAEYIRGLYETGNTEDAFKQMMNTCYDEWAKSHISLKTNTDSTKTTEYMNGDYKLIRTDKLDGIIEAAGQLSERIIALYPTQKDAIDAATRKVYRFAKATLPDFLANWKADGVMAPFFDLGDYAHKLAEETKDSRFEAIAKEMDKAFDEAFVYYADVNQNEQHLDHYTLSVCLAEKTDYTFDYLSDYFSQLVYKPLCNFNTGYEQCTFHKLTGWGNWMNINQQKLTDNPRSGGGGPLY